MNSANLPAMKINIFFAVFLLSLAIARGETLRDWTNQNNQTIRAEFVKLDGETVVLKMGARDYSIPLSTLSESDQHHIAELTAATKDEKEEKEETSPAAKPLISLEKHIFGPELTPADVTAKPLVIHPWQAHCGACPPHLMDFEKFARRKKRLGATFLIWHGYDTPALALSKSEQLELDLPVYHGKWIKWDKEKFGPFVWPHLVLIDAQGKIVYMGQDKRALEDHLKTLLE